MGNPLGQYLRKHTTQLLAGGFSATKARDKEPPVPASAPAWCKSGLADVPCSSINLRCGKGTSVPCFPSYVATKKQVVPQLSSSALSILQQSETAEPLSPSVGASSSVTVPALCGCVDV